MSVVSLVVSINKFHQLVLTLQNVGKLDTSHALAKSFHPPHKSYILYYNVVGMTPEVPKVALVMRRVAGIGGLVELG